MNNYNFQFCQKIVVLSEDMKRVLLCKRKSEEDYDSVFSFIGGKMETSDESILAGLRREKDEEVGENFKIKVCIKFTANILFRKKDGSSMILPHYLAIHDSGKIKLNEEYSGYQWVDLENLSSFEPKIPTIPETIKEPISLKEILKEDNFSLI